MTPTQLEQRLDLWPGLTDGRATLINLSENHTFRIDCPDGSRHILRVHRPGYQNRATIESELNWLLALSADTNLLTVTPLPGINGKLLQEIIDPETGETRFAVRFAFEAGSEAQETGDLVSLFAELGRMAAMCHAHVQNWAPPQGFVRPKWNCDNMLAADGLWGDWRQSPGVTDEVRTTLERAEVALRQSFSAYGQGRERFGLIHADMRLANVLVHNGQTRLIDFDDCGFGWFVYDFAAAVSFFETDPRVEDLKQVWLNAYRWQRPLSAEDESMLDGAILLRRMVLLAWIGTHAEVELAQSMAPHFAAGTADLAQRYLVTMKH